MTRLELSQGILPSSRGSGCLGSAPSTDFRNCRRGACRPRFLRWLLRRLSLSRWLLAAGLLVGFTGELQLYDTHCKWQSQAHSADNSGHRRIQQTTVATGAFNRQQWPQAHSADNRGHRRIQQTRCLQRQGLAQVAMGVAYSFESARFVEWFQFGFCGEAAPTSNSSSGNPCRHTHTHSLRVVVQPSIQQ